MGRGSERVRETVDGETSPGPRRKDAVVPCAGVASWEERQVSLYHTLRRLWAEAAL